jgi:hypothetical protein
MEEAIPLTIQLIALFVELQACICIFVLTSVIDPCFILRSVASSKIVLVCKCMYVSGMEWKGMEQNGMEQNGMAQNGMAQNGMAQNGTEWNRRRE